jgi:hypothetical protein
LHLSGLRWFVWAAVPLVPLGTLTYALKFYRNHLRSSILWTRVASLALIQTAVFLFSFAFLPALAFLVNVVALPIGYYLLDRKLKHLGIERNIGGRAF